MKQRPQNIQSLASFPSMYYELLGALEHLDDDSLDIEFATEQEAQNFRRYMYRFINSLEHHGDVSYKVGRGFIWQLKQDRPTTVTAINKDRQAHLDPIRAAVAKIR